MNEKLKLYRDFFNLLDERSELKLFKKHVIGLLELAESQHREIKAYEDEYFNSSSIEERWKRK